MTLIEKFRQLERLHLLIQRKATGSPAELAHRFNTSERCIYRLINELKSMDVEINYNRHKGSYEYTGDVEINISIEIRHTQQNKVIGGKKYFDYYSSLPDFGSERIYVCHINDH